MSALNFALQSLTVQFKTNCGGVQWQNYKKRHCPKTYGPDCILENRTSVFTVPLKNHIWFIQVLKTNKLKMQTEALAVFNSLKAVL